MRQIVADGREDFYIEDQVHGRWLYDDILNQMYWTAVKDGPFVKIFVEQEPGAAGKNQIAALQKFFREGDSDHRPLPHHCVEQDRSGDPSLPVTSRLQMISGCLNIALYYRIYGSQISCH